MAPPGFPARPPPRPGVTTFRRRGRPLTRLGAALITVLIVLVCGVGIALVRADEGDESLSDRFTPASRGGRSAPLDHEAVIDLVAAYFPREEVGRAFSVIACESRGDPWATGRRGEQGLFQIQPRAWDDLAREMFGPAADLYDAVTNVAVAAAIWRDQGWAPWGCRP
jgi:hypothetical protein